MSTATPSLTQDVKCFATVLADFDTSQLFNQSGLISNLTQKTFLRAAVLFFALSIYTGFDGLWSESET